MFKRIFYTPPESHAVSETPWSSPEEFDETWKRRIEAMSRHLSVPGVVADFGCGMMWLKPVLRLSNTYLGIDCVRRDEHTLVLDLNRDSLAGIRAEAAFLSGVLEYIADLPRFVDELSALPVRQIVCSYCTLEKHPDLAVRRGLNWASHESLFSLLPHFLKRFDLAALDDVNRNTILVFNAKTQ